MKLDLNNKTLVVNLSDSSVRFLMNTDLDIDKEINSFIKYLEYRDKNVNNASNQSSNHSTLKSSTEEYISMWANKPHVICHQILKSFLRVSSKKDIVYKNDIEKEFSKSNPNPGEAISRFTSNFRLMCSDASKAYGRIFKYNKETSEVTLNEQYIDLIQSLRDKFEN